MNIIFFTKGGARARSVHLSHWLHYLIPGILFLCVSVGLVYGGFHWGLRTAPDERLVRWEDELREQRRQIETAQRLTEANIDALTQRLGRLQGHVTRLDALGNKLVKMADIDASEFDFSNPPALGGPEAGAVIPEVAAPSLEGAIDALARQLVERERQLLVLDDAIMTQKLEDEVLPAGRPVKKGWISSYYGMRSDPFTGRPEFHKGVDFAGKAGSDVIAVGGGVVTWSGKRYGYGKMVEINHGNGYVTRYGHNKELVVSEGDVVKKGDVIGKMGSTGRSTGPHVHLEVIHRGKHVNPQKFVQSSR